MGDEIVSVSSSRTEKNRERERERETKTGKERETDRQTGRQTKTYSAPEGSTQIVGHKKDREGGGGNGLAIKRHLAIERDFVLAKENESVIVKHFPLMFCCSLNYIT